MKFLELGVAAHHERRDTLVLPIHTNYVHLQQNRLIDWGWTAFSAQTGYNVPLISMMQLKSEISEKVDNVTCWEYIQYHYNK